MKFAFYIGGPLDGQRHTVKELRPTVDALHAERVTMPDRWLGPESRLTTTQATYVMPSRPINPRVHLAWSAGCDVIDAEIGVYHYVGSRAAR